LRHRIALLPFAVVLLGAAPLAAAGPLRVGTLPLTVTPKVEDDVLRRYRQAVENGMTQAGIPLVPTVQVDQTLPLTSACDDAGCRTKVAQAVQAGYLIAGRLSRAGKNYQVALEVHDPAGAVALAQAGTCDICTLTEAEAKVRDVAFELGTQLKQKWEELDRQARAAPRPPPPRREEPRRVEPRRVEPRPPPRPPVKPAPPLPPPYRFRPSLRQAAWMTGVGGVASLVVGIALLAIDHRPTCQEEPTDRMCPNRYATGAAGATFTALGAASAVASGVLFYFVYGRKRKPAARRAELLVVPAPGGVSTHATIRF
jgi:hypothetical protein